MTAATQERLAGNVEADIRIMAAVRDLHAPQASNDRKDQGGQHIPLPNGRLLPLPEPDPDEKIFTRPTYLVTQVIGELVGTARQLKAILENQQLSDIGRAAKAEEHEDRLLSRVAQAARELDDMEASANENEARFYAPPALEPNDAVGFLRDQEMRTWIRGLSGDDKYNVMKAMQDGKHSEIVLAILRAPTPGGVEEESARFAWQKKRNSDDPALVEHIAAGRRSIDWGRRHLARVAAEARSTAKADEHRILRAVKDGRGLSIFGINK